MTPETAQSLDNLRLERDAILLYDALAAIEKDPTGAPPRSGGSPANERRHADVWAGKLARARRRRPARADPAPAPRRDHRPARPPVRDPGRERPRHRRSRATRRTSTRRQSSPEVAAIAADEREHAEIWRQLKDPARAPGAGADIAARERWHRSGRSGTLRAVIFGVSDGLV